MIESVKTLVARLAELYPVSFTKAQMPAWEERYEAVLGHLTAQELDVAYNATFKDWKKRAAPLPADILAAHASATGARYSVAGIGSAEPVKSFTERLREQDRKRIADKSKIIADYREPRQRLFAQAEVEGWLWRLELQVSRAAHIISQRNELRQPGLVRGAVPVTPLAPHDAAYYCVVTLGNADEIDISDATIEGWRDEAMTPGPATGRRTVSDRALAAAGEIPMEVSYGPDPLAMP